MSTERCFQHPDQEFRTEHLSNDLDPINCAGENCGWLLGWIDTRHSDGDGLYYCGCCARDLTADMEMED